MSLTTVLNPALYEALEAHFGSVKVSMEGQAFSAVTTRDIFTKRPRLEVRQSGEHYCVNCCCCTDTKHRLWINHTYGQEDEWGRIKKYLAICYNETACMSEPQNSAYLWGLLSDKHGVLKRARLRPGRIMSASDRETSMPGPCVRLNELRPSHHARTYLSDRGFDPDRLARTYGISYCIDSHYFLARNRIIIPVFQGGKLRGWQARYIGELPWHDKTKSRDLPPKYFTEPFMHRRELLYNWDRARAWQTAIIVEGPTDVWRFGPMAMCTFGDSMPVQQRDKLIAVFRGRSAVLLYDPEAMEEESVQKVIEDLTVKLSGRLAVVVLPSGTDPGSLDRHFLRRFIKAEAAKQGVKVVYEQAAAAACSGEKS
jgi:hypothetical protein